MLGHSLSIGYVSLTREFPFSSSSPTLTIATLGFLMPTTFSIYIEPITAHCTSIVALASTLAPLSTSSETPSLVGISAAIGGLSTPRSLPTIV